MSIDFTGVTGIEDDYGNLTKITDASGRVLWSSTIKFTINGDTYIADRGMTWAEWFASDYNTTGETEGDITDANGNEVSMDSVIVGGTAYEVGFDDGMRDVSIFSATSSTKTYITIDGVTYGNSMGTFNIRVPVGTVVNCYGQNMAGSAGAVPAQLHLNGEIIKSGAWTYSYVVETNVEINICCYGFANMNYVKITEK
jgi:hypothetical protein